MTATSKLFKVSHPTSADLQHHLEKVKLKKVKAIQLKPVCTSFHTSTMFIMQTDVQQVCITLFSPFSDPSNSIKCAYITQICSNLTNMVKLKQTANVQPHVLCCSVTCCLSLHHNSVKTKNMSTCSRWATCSSCG